MAAGRCCAPTTAAGHDEIAFDELQVGLNESELTGLAVGGPAANRVGRVRLDYRPPICCVAASSR